MFLNVLDDIASVVCSKTRANIGTSSPTINSFAVNALDFLVNFQAIQMGLLYVSVHSNCITMQQRERDFACLQMLSADFVDRLKLMLNLSLLVNETIFTRTVTKFIKLSGWFSVWL